MTKIKLKIKNSGFVILFAVTLAAILLSIALGVSNVALREIKFGTSAKDTNEAFFAADTGAECALVNDKSTGSAFDGNPHSFSCNGGSVSITGSSPWTLIVPGPGGSFTQNCSIVTVNKPADGTTTVISKGHNKADSPLCSSNPNTVERQLEVRY